MELIDIEDVTYACEIHQQDEKLPWLLMLHGFMGDHRVFSHVIDGLMTFSNPVTIDLLGHGKTSKPSEYARYNEVNQINDICRVIETLDIGRLFLFGYSMGGRLALKTALEAPGLFEGLLLESTTCGITDPSKRKERQKLDSSWASEIQKDYNDFLSGWKKLELFQSPLSTDETLIKKYRQVQSEQSPPALAASLHGFGTGSMTPACDDLEQFDLPVLLMAGSKDEKYQQMNQYLEEQFPNATFSSIWAGHRTHLDNPSAFLSELKNFIHTGDK
jgi:2-succinyl-6-hydroxy-2,4-cyclohexadiene-1-carboxylate synthase